MKKFYKIWKITSPIIILLISSLIHNVYQIFPSPLTKIFFPINESIWEHTKMIFLAYFIFMILEMLIFKKKNFNYVISAIFCSILILIIFSFVYFYILNKQDNLLITLLIYFLCLTISQIYYYGLKVNLKNSQSLIIWLIIFTINGILTYYPLRSPLFTVYMSLF